MSKEDVSEHLRKSIPRFLVMVIVFVFAILGLIVNFHSYHIAWKIIIPILLAIFSLFVLFQLLLIFHDIKLVFFPPKSIFIDGDDIKVWKLVESLKISLRRRGWAVVNNEDDSDFRITLGRTWGEDGILCQIEDRQGRRETVELSNMFWPGEPTALIEEFARDTHR